MVMVPGENFSGAGHKYTIVLDKPETRIGRQEDCDLVLDDPLISREHCEISTDEDGDFFIRDLGSKNSTYVNKNAVRKKRRIFYGDRISLGDTILRFFLEEKIRKR